MRSMPWVAGLASAIAAAFLFLPAAAADPDLGLADASVDPVALADDATATPEGLVVPQGLPGPVQQVPLLQTGFCYFSSEFSFCTSPDGLWPSPMRPETFTVMMPEEEAAAAEDVAEEVPAGEARAEEPVAQPQHQVADSGAPGPREPEPASDAPAPASSGDVEPVPVAASVPGVNWAVVTAAITLPWAIGLKVLATLLGLRRAGQLAAGETGRPSLRDAVLQAIAQEPGIRHSDLVARIGRGNGTVEHHVKALLAQGRLARVRGLGSTLYFPAATFAESEARMRLALQGRTSRRMAGAIAARPGIRLAELARELGISGATAHYQAGKLARAGVLREEAGTGRRLAVTEPAMPVVACLVAGQPSAAAQGQALVPGATSA